MEDRWRSLVARFREFFPARRRLVLGSCVLAGVFLLFLLAPNREGRPGHPPVPLLPEHVSPNSEALSPEDLRLMSSDTKEANALRALRAPSELYKVTPSDAGGFFREPRMAYSAELTVVTKEFARSRSNLEEILERHRGYVAKLRMAGQPSGSILSATLRVPSSEYRSALTELKAVGLVEHEEEAADEITQQHGELEARLVNAQNEEQRVLRLHRNRADKADDFETLKRQVSLLHGEIERMEAERYATGSRVSFANVFFSLREERIPPAETIGAKLRVAAVSGLSDAFESVSTILLFLAGRGPLLALWAVLLYFPGRFFWRRYHPAEAFGTTPSRL
jgi:hypothetical protein